MSNPDPELERRRLAETYAGLSDSELERTSLAAGELTGTARELLQEEIKRRGLAIQANSEFANDESQPEFQELVTLRQFRDLPEALLAKGSLESAGIECGLWDDNLVRLDWFWSNLVGGIRLKVRSADVDISNEILDQPIPADFEVPGIGDYQQPSCPKCQSLDVAYQELYAPVAYISAYIGVPIPMERHAWRCHAWHAEWEDEDSTPDSGLNPALE